MKTLLLTIIQNITVLGFCALLFARIGRSTNWPSRWAGTVYYIAVGTFLTCLVSEFPLVTPDGAQYSLRNLPAIVLGVFGGPVLGVATGFLGGLYRLWLGGPTAFQGFCGVFLSGLCAGGMSRMTTKGELGTFPIWRSIIPSFIATPLIVLVIYATLPAEMFSSMLGMLLPLNLVFQPMAVLVLTYLLQDDIKTYQRQVELIDRARRDAKTSLANSQDFDEFLSRTLADPSQQPVSVLFIDLDHFKKVNDIHGHEMGDHVLRELSARLSSSIRPLDKVARYGGEEFTICIPQCDFGRALSIADRIRIAIDEEPFCRGLAAKSIHLTVSIGVACGHEITAEQLLRRADKAMYAAKNSGRNRVVGYTMLTGDLASAQ